MDFGQALAALKDGHRVTRDGWNGAGMWIALQVPDVHSKMRRPYLYMSPVGGGLVPWIASQTDLLADDWAIVPGVGGPVRSGGLYIVGEQDGFPEETGGAP